MGDSDRYMTKNILCEATEELCSVDIDTLHYFLMGLPAEKYFELYKLMTLEVTKVFPHALAID